MQQCCGPKDPSGHPQNLGSTRPAAWTPALSLCEQWLHPARPVTQRWATGQVLPHKRPLREKCTATEAVCVKAWTNSPRARPAAAGRREAVTLGKASPLRQDRARSQAWKPELVSLPRERRFCTSQERISQAEDLETLSRLQSVRQQVGGSLPAQEDASGSAWARAPLSGDLLQRPSAGSCEPHLRVLHRTRSTQSW